MARVPTYTSTEDITLTDRAASAAAQFASTAAQVGQARAAMIRQAGRDIRGGLEDIGKAIEEYEKKKEEHEELMELATVNRQFLQLQNNAIADYNRFMSSLNPDDPEYREAPDKWLTEQYQSRLDAIRQNIKNPKVLRHFESLSMRGLTNMAEHVRSDMAKRDLAYVKDTITDVWAMTAQATYGPGTRVEIQSPFESGSIPAYWDTEFVKRKIEESKTILYSMLGAWAEKGYLSPEQVRQLADHIEQGEILIKQQVLLQRQNDNPQAAAEALQKDPFFQGIFAPKGEKGETTLQRFIERGQERAKALIDAQKAAEKQYQEQFDDVKQKAISQLRVEFNTLLEQGGRATPDMLKRINEIMLMPGTGKHDKEAQALYEKMKDSAFGQELKEPNAMSVVEEQQWAIKILRGQATEADLDLAATALAGPKQITEQGYQRLKNLLNTYKQIYQTPEYKLADEQIKAWIKDRFKIGNIYADPNGASDYAAYQLRFMPEFRRRYLAGELKAGDLDIRNEKGLMGQIAKEVAAYTTIDLSPLGKMNRGIQFLQAPDGKMRYTGQVPANLENRRKAGKLLYNPQTQNFIDKETREVFDLEGKLLMKLPEQQPKQPQPPAPTPPVSR